MNNIKNMKTQIKTEIVADSLSPQGDRLISLLITFPRIILAEVNTHRMLSKNTSSSRAIPFKKMVESVENDPFIPIAWQKNHSGMQGTEYLSKTDKFNLSQFVSVMIDTLNNMTDRSSKDFKQFEKEVEERVNLITGLLSKYTHFTMTLDEWWLFARDKAVEAASIMYVFRVTKQLCNRLLEPFMWTTMLITGSKEGWDNFFELRCPQYYYDLEDKYFKSKKEWLSYYKANCIGKPNSNFELDEIDWFNINKGQAEIHIMDLAEKVYDAMNENIPRQLKSGEWHIPFADRFDSYSNLNTDVSAIDLRRDFDMNDIKISTAMAARTSYTVVGDEKEIDYQKQLELHDRLISQDPPHSSPMEHCARAMSEVEYNTFFKGEDLHESSSNFNIRNKGWCNNYKGFIQYRYLIENYYEEIQ